MSVFEKKSPMPVGRRALFDWHAREGAFERLAPPWERIEVLEKSGTIRDGDRLVMAMKLGPLTQRWVALHSGYEEGRKFEDVQVSGPFKAWHHTHRFLPTEDVEGGAEDEARSILSDSIAYRLPFGALGALFGGGFARAQLRRMFAFRHRRTREDLMRHQRFQDRPRLTVAISGASGLLGDALGSFLRTGGHRVIPMIRGGGEGIPWSAAEERLDPKDLKGVDAVIHLAGESIQGRWTEEKKARIRESRVKGTRTIARAMAAAAKEGGPKVLLCASAVGFYGDRGDAPVDEESPRGEGFLPEVTQAWEEAADPAREAGLRVAHLRLGVVLSGKGGALATMKLPFSMGLGGPVGSGDQYMSWVALEDAVGAFHHALFDEGATGPINVVAPHPVKNKTFGETMGRVLRRPAFLPLPGFAVKLALGEMGQTLLLEGAKVLPTRLDALGFAFNYPDLEGALRMELGKLKEG